jgi:3-oxoacyl-[acyl-carrier-protein] synthase-3
VFLQRSSGIAGEGKGKSACFDIRQQCSAFVYGLQMADAFVAPACTSACCWSAPRSTATRSTSLTRGRDVTVLFGDGAGAMVLGPLETDDPRSRRPVHPLPRRRQRRR